jgi:signal transduction histidine kinase
MIKSIFGKLLFSHLAIILVSMLTLGILMSYLVRNHVIENKRNDLLAKGHSAVTMITNVLSDGRKPSNRMLAAMGEMAGGNIWIMDKNGQILVGQTPAIWKDKYSEYWVQSWDSIDWQNGGGTQKVFNPRQSDPSIVVALPLPSLEPGVPAALFLRSPVTGTTRTVQALEQLLLYALSASAFAAALIGFFMARSLTRPIANISQAAAAFIQGDYTNRTTATQADEIGQLGRTLNGMAEELEQIEQNRREFLSDVSHELKTPLASIQALAEAIQDGLVKTEETRDRYLTNIVAETKRIGLLVGDLLNLSQLEAGELLLVRTPIDLPALITAHLARFTPFAEEKSLVIATNIPSTLAFPIADPDRLGQVLTNLVSNAIRYADRESIILITAEKQHQQIAVSISNTGPGIPPEHLPHIWKRFYRVDKSRARGDGGTGLGLAITKKLVTAMGGSVDVVSTPGKITTFTFTLPVT